MLLEKIGIAIITGIIGSQSTEFPTIFFLQKKDFYTSK